MSKASALPEVVFLKRPCSYISHKVENLLYVLKPDEQNDFCTTAQYDLIRDNYGSEGMRRSGSDLYLPVCPNCNECISTRVIVDQFQPSRRHRRAIAANEDIEIEISHEQKPTDKQLFELYSSYLELRHQDGAMYPPDVNTMRHVFELDGSQREFHIYGYINNQLILAAMTDQLSDGLSANYTIYDASLTKRSLGTFAILTQIELCQQYSLPYLYLGYMLRTVPNMAYKQDFQPQEQYHREGWIRT